MRPRHVILVPAYIILINFLLMLIFLTYAIFAAVLIYGINTVRVQV
jgi:hypothetical protein